MTRKHFSFASLIGLMCLIASFVPMQNDNKDMAKIDPVEGVSVFYQCKPVAASDYVGTIKVGVTMTNKTSDCLRALVKKVKKDYPGADGIIITDPDFQKADAIKFK